MLLILPPFIALIFLFHAKMMVMLYHYTPFTAQNIALTTTDARAPLD
jgi:hypothetical protein